MRIIYTIAMITISQLRRQKIFASFLCFSIVILLGSQLLSQWMLEDKFQLAQDLCTALLHLGGTLCALYWGSQILGKSQDRAIFLCGPIRRWEWFVGRYMGLACTLCLCCASQYILWEGLVLAIYPEHASWAGSLILFATHLIGWLSAAALSACLASIAEQQFSFFASLSLWLCGLMLPLIPAAEPSPATFIGKVWNTQVFNTAVSSVGLVHTLIYGLSLILGCLLVAIWSVSARDID